MFVRLNLHNREMVLPLGSIRFDVDSFFCYFVPTHDIPFKNVFALVSLFIFSLSFFLFFLLLFLVWFCIAWLSGVLFRYVDALFVWWNKKKQICWVRDTEKNELVVIHIPCMPYCLHLFKLWTILTWLQ